ncbi:MAG: hypothetical protein A2X13_14795 [Bacteroidetes bacterium GWC2_33_15]|nr:MAG: hypothetical protein A2X10_06860 [Bacteroidetes bacterium GWA2_33_15]OFX50141.1 MAG: hypothetical protein A2X13_14795 [Bacteroidetes bacterium GWC2_33_15]OFX65294.1 MAG: hypothetical protein A2X15_04370 [Bacteroidetes bacterium GWB2_32_14]OFX70520.1 MAG: hypothetical protein A2X14_04425 [Bacteroidetes bacterium GWD2_33_33]HAN19607.1 hypothetical protein [Bacteroidales bacterium]
MKKIIFILLILVSTLSVAQNPYGFEDIIKVDSLSKDEIYDLARIWFTETFVSANNVLQIQDKEAGQLIGRGSIGYTSATFMANEAVNGNISFLVKIFVKDGRFKYIITDFNHKGTPSKYCSSGVNFGIITEQSESPIISRGNPAGWHNKQWEKMKHESAVVAASLIRSMKEKIKKDKLQNDW